MQFIAEGNETVNESLLINLPIPLGDCVIETSNPNVTYYISELYENELENIN